LCGFLYFRCEFLDSWQALVMKDFFLNFTKILETNSKIYWSLIIGIVGCLILYIAEIVHIQNVLAQMTSQESTVIRTIIDPIAQRYQWSRIAFIVFALIWSNFQYRKTKKMLNLA
jgi:hypothetical protein